MNLNFLGVSHIQLLYGLSEGGDGDRTPGPLATAASIYDYFK